MRLSVALRAMNKGYWYKQLWKKKSKYSVTNAAIPPAITKLGIVPSDPLDELYTSKHKEVWIPPEDPRFMFPPRLEDDPNYHKTKAYSVNTETKLWEGVKQAQILTNAVVTTGLPDSVISRLDQYSLPDQDYLMQRNILQAHLWDTARENLPHREKPEDVSIWHFKREFGIPPSRSCHLMLNKVLHQCTRQAAVIEPTSTLNRRAMEDHVLHAQITFDEKPVYVTSTSKFLVTSASPIPPFVENEQIQDTKGITLPDLFPISPMIDLDITHIYVKDADLGYVPNIAHPYHHTLYLAYDISLSMDMRHANALLMSYAHCLQQAKQRFPSTDVKEPITIQTVHTNGVSFGYTFFQLNTIHNSDNVQNMAWVDSDNMFEKLIPRRAMLRNTKYSKYNPDVGRKLVAMYFS